MSLYAADGSYNVTVVSGDTYTGIYAPDGSFNVVLNDGTSYVGLYHPCGGYNLCLSDNGSYGVQHPSGSINASSSPYVPGTVRITIVAGGYDAYILYDDFSGTVASLNGRTPDKGSDWSASGAAAGNMTAGAGKLTQDADTYPSIGAGYAFNNLGEVAKKLTAEWNTSEITYVPTVAICTSTDGSLPFLHGEGGTTNFVLRLGESSTFTLPGWSLWTPAYTLSADTAYTTELHYNGAKMAAMVLKDSNGIVGQQVSYDTNMANYVGNYAFWETFDTKMWYTKATAVDTSDYTFPTITPTLEASKPSFIAGPFGGSVVTNTDDVSLLGDTYVQGGSISIGSITTGDKIYVSYDVTAQTGGNVMSIITTGVAGAAAAEIYNVPAGTGRVQTTTVFTVTADVADASFIIGNDGLGGSTSITVKNLLVLKNPPTSF